MGDHAKSKERVLATFRRFSSDNTIPRSDFCRTLSFLMTAPCTVEQISVLLDSAGALREDRVDVVSVLDYIFQEAHPRADVAMGAATLQLEHQLEPQACLRPLRIEARDLAGQFLAQVEATPMDSIVQLRRQIAEAVGGSEHFRLIFGDAVLDDAEALRLAGLCDGAAVQVLYEAPAVGFYSWSGESESKRVWSESYGSYWSTAYFWCELELFEDCRASCHFTHHHMDNDDTLVVVNVTCSGTWVLGSGGRVLFSRWSLVPVSAHGEPEGPEVMLVESGALVVEHWSSNNGNMKNIRDKQDREDEEEQEQLEVQKGQEDREDQEADRDDQDAYENEDQEGQEDQEDQEDHEDGDDWENQEADHEDESLNFYEDMRRYSVIMAGQVFRRGRRAPPEFLYED